MSYLPFTSSSNSSGYRLTNRLIDKDYFSGFSPPPEIISGWWEDILVGVGGTWYE